MGVSCDTLVVLGADARNGHTIFAKNSDRPPTECQPLHVAPRRSRHGAPKRSCGADQQTAARHRTGHTRLIPEVHHQQLPHEALVRAFAVFLLLNAAFAWFRTPRPAATGAVGATGGTDP